MSSPTPRPTPRPSRRRIAGERRGRAPGTDAGADAGTDAMTVEEPALEPSVRADEPTDTEPTSEPAPEDPAEDGPSTPATGPSTPVLVVLGVVALVLVLAAAYLGLVRWDVRDVREADAVDDAATSAPAAAERAAAAVLSYRWTSLDADEAAAERYLTPEYRARYAKTFDRGVRPNARKLRAVVRAQVKASGVVHADRDRVDVLVYVDQTTTSTANDGQPQVALNRVRLSMVRSGGRWLVDDVTSY